MKILFVDGQHLPKPDANGNCVQKLRKQLYALSVESDVLTFCLDRSDLQHEEDECGVIYAVSLFMQDKLGEFGFKVLNHVSGGKYVWEKRYSKFMCMPMKKKLEELCKRNNYDWVVSVSFPFCIHSVSTEADLNGAKIALYNLDPYAFNEALPIINRKKRLKEECYVYEKADVIFTSLEHYDDWQSLELSRYLSKAKFIPYPNLVPYDGVYVMPQLENKENWKEIVYVGAFHDRVRQPKAMLELFESMLSIDEKYRLIIAGNRSGDLVEQQLKHAQEKLGAHLVVMNAISFPQAMGWIKRADAVINLGNQMKNQMPSKILDYIAAGKTIINISHNKPCNTKPYFEKYERVVQLYEDELLGDCKDASCKVISEMARYRADMEWEKVRTCMDGLLAGDVARKFLNVLLEIKNVNSSEIFLKNKGEISENK